MRVGRYRYRPDLRRLLRSDIYPIISNMVVETPRTCLARTLAPSWPTSDIGLS